MDLERVKALARTRTGRAWPAQPVRSLLWRLMKPYFQSFAEVLEEQVARLERQAGFAAESVDPGDHESLALEIDALRKDVKAIGHCLAGLEEQAALGGSPRP